VEKLIFASSRLDTQNQNAAASNKGRCLKKWNFWCVAIEAQFLL